MQIVASPFVYAPVKKGEELAELKISFKGREVRRIPLYSAEEADVKQVKDSGEKDEKNWFKKFITKLGKYFS